MRFMKTTLPKVYRGIIIPPLNENQSKRIALEIEALGFITIKEDVDLGLHYGYPKCCIQYYILSRVNPNLPRWGYPGENWISCPAHSLRPGSFLSYTWEEAGHIIEVPLNSSGAKR